MSVKLKFIFLGGIIIILLFIFGYNDPSSNFLFPKCPFLSLTGLQCPGCGSQRAVHQLINGNLGSAFHYNPLLVLSLPYIFLGFLFEARTMKLKYPKVQNFLFGYKTMYVILGIIILFWVGRNVIGLLVYWFIG